MDEELRHLLERRQAKVEAYKKEVALDRRSRMSPTELQDWVLDAWRPLIDALESRTIAWSEALSAYGVRISFLRHEEMELSDNPAWVRISVHDELDSNAHGQPLDFKLIVQPKAEIAYVAPEAKGPSVSKGCILLYEGDAIKAAWRVASAYITGLIT